MISLDPVPATSGTSDQVRRSQYLFSVQMLFLGDYEKAFKASFELLQDSYNAGDSLNFHAAKRVIASIPNRRQSEKINEGEYTMNTTLSAAAIQRDILAAMELHRSSDVRGAVQILQGVCKSLRSWRNADEYTSSVYSWLATFSREALLRVGRGHETTYQELKQTFVQSVRNAVRVADRFENERPHAYREAAWKTAMFGSGHHGHETLRLLMSSLLRARAKEMIDAEIATLKAWKSMSGDFELGIPSMPDAERERFTALTRNETGCGEIDRPIDDSPAEALGNLVLEIERALSNQSETQIAECQYSELSKQ
jgi:hypothetical protein